MPFYKLGQQAAFEKLGIARWVKELRRASPGAAEGMMGKLWRNVGMAPPPPRFYKPKKLETYMQSVRQMEKVPVPEIAPRGSELWREAMKDVQAGRMLPLESGLTTEQARRIQQFGPSTPGALGSAGTSAVPSSYKQEMYRLMKENPKLMEAIEDRYASGLYASRAGTPRTADYARSAATVRGGTPGQLEFSIPEAFTKHLLPGKEVTVPRNLFQQWARDIKTVPHT